MEVEGLSRLIGSPFSPLSFIIQGSWCVRVGMVVTYVCVCVCVRVCVCVCWQRMGVRIEPKT